MDGGRWFSDKEKCVVNDKKNNEKLIASTEKEASWPLCFVMQILLNDYLENGKTDKNYFNPFNAEQNLSRVSARQRTS